MANAGPSRRYGCTVHAGPASPAAGARASRLRRADITRLSPATCEPPPTCKGVQDPYGSLNPGDGRRPSWASRSPSGLARGTRDGSRARGRRWGSTRSTGRPWQDFPAAQRQRVGIPGTLAVAQLLISRPGFGPECVGFTRRSSACDLRARLGLGPLRQLISRPGVVGAGGQESAVSAGRSWNWARRVPLYREPRHLRPALR
jgi:hypothetical protein